MKRQKRHTSYFRTLTDLREKHRELYSKTADSVISFRHSELVYKDENSSVMCVVCRFPHQANRETINDGLYQSLTFLRNSIPSLDQRPAICFQTANVVTATPGQYRVYFGIESALLRQNFIKDRTAGGQTFRIPSFEDLKQRYNHQLQPSDLTRLLREEMTNSGVFVAEVINNLFVAYVYLDENTKVMNRDWEFNRLMRLIVDSEEPGVYKARTTGPREKSRST